MKHVRLAIMVLSSVAFCTGISNSAKASSCDDEATSTMEMESCALSAFNVADAELNLTNSDIESRTEPADRNRLHDTQRNWSDLRDRECKSRADSMQSGGTLLSLAYQICRVEMTEARVDELRKDSN